MYFARLDVEQALAEVDDAVGVTPLVVVPGADLDPVAVEDLGEAGIEDRRVRIVDDVDRDDRVDGVLEDVAQIGHRRVLHRLVDLLDGRFFVQLDNQVADRTVGHRHAIGHALHFAVEFGNDRADRLGRAGRGRDDRQRGAAGPPRIAVREVEQALVVGVGVHGDHVTAFHAEGVVQDLDHRSGAVGGARGVGNQLHVLGQHVVVDAEHDGGVQRVFGRHGEHDFLRAGLEVAFQLFALAEDAGGVDDDVDLEFLPGQFGRVFDGGQQNLVAADEHEVLFDPRRVFVDAVDRIVFEAVEQLLGVGQVVDADEFEINVAFQGGAQHGAADSTKSINRYS